MPDVTISAKYSIVRYLGATLPLNTTNFPWLSNVLKVQGFTPSNSAGANANTAYTGAYNGLTPGGTLQSLTTNTTYTIVSGVVGWMLPNAIEIKEIGFVPAGVIIADSDGYTPKDNTRPISQLDLVTFLRPGPNGLDALIASLAGGGTTNPTLGNPTVSFGTTTATTQVVNWTDVTNATNYTVKRNTTNTQAGAATIYNGPLLTFTDSGLAAATPYFYFVAPTATGYTAGLGTGTVTTAAAAPSSSTLLAIDPVQQENTTRTGASLTNTDNALWRCRFALKLVNNAIGFVRFTPAGSGTAAMILTQNTVLPNNFTFGNRFSIYAEYGSYTGGYKDNQITPTGPMPSGASLGYRFEVVNGVHTVFYEVSDSAGANWTTFDSHPSEGLDCTLAFYAGPGSVAQNITYSGMVTV